MTFWGEKTVPYEAHSKFDPGKKRCPKCFGRGVRLWTEMGENGPEPMSEDPCSTCQGEGSVADVRTQSEEP